MRVYKSAILISLIFASIGQAFAATSTITDAKTLFSMISKLESSIPLRKSVVEELCGCPLHTRTDQIVEHDDGRSKEYVSDVSKSNLVSNIWLQEETPPTESAKGMIIIYLNKAKVAISESAVRAVFGRPDEIDNALNADINEAGQPKSLLYHKKWGLLMFGVDKTPEYSLKKVCLQAIVMPPLGGHK